MCTQDDEEDSEDEDIKPVAGKKRKAVVSEDSD